MAEEILLGYIPKRDGEGYNPSSGSPTFNQMLLEIDLNDMHDFVIVLIGKLYRGQSRISHAAFTTDADTVRRWKREKGSYNDRLQGMLNMNEAPVHVTGIILKKIR